MLMALTCVSSDELVRFLTAVDDVCAECGLCINAAKTGVMMAGRPSSQSLPAVISLRGGQVQQTSKFKYLG